MLAAIHDTTLFSDAWTWTSGIAFALRAITLAVSLLAIRFVHKIDEIDEKLTGLTVPKVWHLRFTATFATFLATVSAFLLYKGPGFGLPIWLNLIYGGAFVWTIAGLLILGYTLLDGLGDLFLQRQKLVAHVMNCKHPEAECAERILKIRVETAEDD